jgi:hypothetical protein
MESTWGPQLCPFFLEVMGNPVYIYIVLFSIHVIHVVMYIPHLAHGVDVGAPTVSIPPDGHKEILFTFIWYCLISV